MNKKLSLVIPCYNEEKNLPLLVEKCEKIFLEETFGLKKNDIEIILVNNGSNDNSEQVLTKLLDQHEFIRSIKVEVNQGYGYGILYGLKHAKGEILAWTHADLQTDPYDAITGFKYFNEADDKQKIFVKGLRSGRTAFDTFFTIGMSAFETLLLRKILWDINAQPTMFHKSFYQKLEINAPHDFSLDLYFYFKAKENHLNVKRIPVIFAKRIHGVSSWNVDFKSKIKFIKRTMDYSFKLLKRI